MASSNMFNCQLTKTLWSRRRQQQGTSGMRRPAHITVPEAVPAVNEHWDNSRLKEEVADYLKKNRPKENK
jgi:hypothetical protein